MYDDDVDFFQTIEGPSNLRKFFNIFNILRVEHYKARTEIAEVNTHRKRCEIHDAQLFKNLERTQAPAPGLKLNRAAMKEKIKALEATVENLKTEKAACIVKVDDLKNEFYDGIGTIYRLRDENINLKKMEYEKDFKDDMMTKYLEFHGLRERFLDIYEEELEFIKQPKAVRPSLRPRRPGHKGINNRIILEQKVNTIIEEDEDSDSGIESLPRMLTLTKVPPKPKVMPEKISPPPQIIEKAKSSEKPQKPKRLRFKKILFFFASF